MKKPLPKAELYKRMERFAADKKKALSWEYFSDLAGVDVNHLRNIFINRTAVLTEYVQIRVSKALERLENGDVTLMRNRHSERFLQYNQTPKPRMVKSTDLVLRDGKIELKIGIKNRNDYSEATLGEQLKNARR